MNATERLRDLYNRYPRARAGFDGPYNKGLEFHLSRVNSHPPRDFSMAELDKYGEGDFDSSYSLSILLGYLPPRIIHSEFGDDALLWTYVRFPYSGGHQKALGEGIQAVSGRNSERFEKARLVAWRLLRSSKVKLIKSIYDFGEKILGGVASSVDLGRLLQENAKERVQLSEKRFGDYALTPMITQGTDPVGYEATLGLYNSENKIGDKRYSIWLDSPFGLGLTYKKQPNAVIGFFPLSLNTVLISQIQGIRPVIIGKNGLPAGKSSSRGLAPLNWKELLVDVAEDISRKLGYSEIGIQGARNNYWTTFMGANGKPHLSLEDALDRYDRLAHRLKFRKRGDDNWYRKIENSRLHFFQNINPQKRKGIFQNLAESTD